MPNGKGRRRRNGRPGYSRNTQRPSATPRKVLTRDFRYVDIVALNNYANGTPATIDSVPQGYSYLSKYVKFDPSRILSWEQYASTFEYYRIKRAQVFINIAYNQSNNTYVNRANEATCVSQVWTAADWSSNETVSGRSIFNYNNAKLHTLSINDIKQIVSMTPRWQSEDTQTKSAVFPTSFWIDTTVDDNYSKFNGFQLHIEVPGDSLTATNRYKYTVTTQLTIEFKQPSFQSVSSSIDGSLPGTEIAIIVNDVLDETLTIAGLKSTIDGISLKVDSSNGGSQTHPLSWLRAVIADRALPLPDGRVAQYSGPPIPVNLKSTP